MIRCQTLVAMTLVALLSAAMADKAMGQDSLSGKLEIALLSGVTILMYNGGLSTTTIGIPQGPGTFPVSPGIRLTLWGDLLNTDLGFSFLQENSGPRVITVEGGLGPRLPGQTNFPLQSFLTAVGGILSIRQYNHTHTETYLGGIAGVRAFIHRDVTARIQVGYRRMLGGEFKFHSWEIGAGLGVFL